MAKQIKRDFLNGDKIDEIMLALNATKIQSSPKIVAFILSLNQAIEDGRDLTIKEVLRLFKIIFNEKEDGK